MAGFLPMRTRGRENGKSYGVDRQHVGSTDLASVLWASDHAGPIGQKLCLNGLGLFLCANRGPLIWQSPKYDMEEPPQKPMLWDAGLLGQETVGNTRPVRKNRLLQGMH